MSTQLAAAGAAVDGIVVKSDDPQLNTADSANASQIVAVERRRKPRRSLMARPVGIQFRNDYKLFRVS